MLLTERARLEPGRRPLAVPGRHGGFDCAGLLVLVGYGASTRGLGQSVRGEAVWWGSGGEGDLAIVRLLGPSAQAVRGVTDALLRRGIEAASTTSPAG